VHHFPARRSAMNGRYLTRYSSHHPLYFVSSTPAPCESCGIIVGPVCVPVYSLLHPAPRTTRGVSTLKMAPEATGASQSRHIARCSLLQHVGLERVSLILTVTNPTPADAAADRDAGQGLTASVEAVVEPIAFCPDIALRRVARCVQRVCVIFSTDFSALTCCPQDLERGKQPPNHRAYGAH
jgi:hypothetical protein